WGNCGSAASTTLAWRNWLVLRTLTHRFGLSVVHVDSCTHRFDPRVVRFEPCTLHFDPQLGSF
ncbi:MAG TPA: hypothetical protein VLC46_24515, partial [Thermoanaerobaculia bacterium]|nr:hypothetical protein [Thermoanaerobaculia bacterium]